MRTFLLILLLCSSTSVFSQPDVPVLKTNVSILDIKDGDLLKKEYWHIDTELKPDIYTADKTGRAKTVSFYSDVDSITFQIHPGEFHDFLIVFNKTDTCYTQIKSGIVTVDSHLIELKQDTIPFTLTNANNIIIEAILNDADTVQMMFHTAQASVALTRDAIAEIGADRFDQSIEAEAWGGKSKAEYSLGNDLEIEGLNWSELTIWADENTGPTADGKFGINLFPEKVIELNFDENVMVIHSRLPDVAADYEKLDLLFQNEMMFAETEFRVDDEEYTRKVLIHSGFGGTLLLDEEYIEKHRLRESLEISSGGNLKDAYGNIIKTEKASLPYFTFGSTSFGDLPIGFFAGKIGGVSRSVMGGNLIKRFNMFIDLQNAYIYLQPSGYLDQPWNPRS